LQYQYTYDPFGNFTTSGQPPSGYGNVYGMAGIEIDPTGLYHANARYYNPALTRFVSEDPQRGKANMFTYAGNGPIGNSDISGMSEDGGGFCICSLAPIFDGALIGLTFPGSTPAPSYNKHYKEQQGETFKTIGMRISANVYSQGGIQLAQAEGSGGGEEDDEDPEGEPPGLEPPNELRWPAPAPPSHGRPTTPRGLAYSRHALDNDIRYPDRLKITGHMIDLAIEFGQAYPTDKGRTVYYSHMQNLSVVLEPDGEIVTFYHGKARGVP
jgi:RHS repeat-associated protein